MWTAIAVILAGALASSTAANSPWLQASSLPYTPAYHSLLAHGNRLIVIGGDIGSGPLDKVLIATAQADGTIAAWQESPDELPQAVAEQAAVMLGRRIYVIGGTNGRTALRTTFSAAIADGGQIGKWQSAPALLPLGVRGHAGAAVGRDLFVIGGRDAGGKVRDEVYRTAVDADGELRGWERWGSLPQSLSHAATAGDGKRVYLIGGENEKGPVQATYTGVPGPGGELRWRSQRPLPKPSSRGAAFVDGMALFYLGGYDGTTTSAEAFVAPINDDGSLGDWTGWLPLPKGMMAWGAVSLNGRAYLAGGFDGARFVSSVLYLTLDKPAPATPTSPSIGRTAAGERLDLLTVAVAAFGSVAFISLLVVGVALALERRSPSKAGDK